MCSNKILLGLVSSFAAGIFISLSLIHILPEQNKNYLNDWSSKLNGFPLPTVIMFAGYSIILLLDWVLFNGHAEMHAKMQNDKDTSKVSNTTKSALVEWVMQIDTPNEREEFENNEGGDSNEKEVPVDAVLE